jgi:hypothetical protein
MKLTESQARNAIRKWLFEYTTDSGVSHRPSTDDKIAGKLGDDREDQPAATIPQETPIVAMSQMSTQLSDAMPPIEDPDFIPGTVEELGRSVDLLSQQVPYSEIEWFYSKFQDLAGQAIEMGNSVDLNRGFLDDDMQINSVLKPAQKSSGASAKAANESWKRWSGMLSNTLSEARKNPKDPLNLRRRNLTAHDMRPYRPDDEDAWMSDYDLDGNGALDREEMAAAAADSSMTGDVIDGEYFPSPEDMEDMATEMEMDIQDLPGYDPRRHSPEQRQADLASGVFDGEAKLRELVAMNLYPSVRTLSGMKKKIAADIDPVVQMYVTARPAFDWLAGWYKDEYQLNWNGRQISGPDVYLMAIKAYEAFFKKDKAMLKQLHDVISSGGFYVEAMAEIVMAPLVRKWVHEVKNNPQFDVSSSKSRNNLMMSDWILETVLDKGFGKSGNKRKAKKLVTAMSGMQEFKSAMAEVGLANEKMKSEES